MDDLAVPLDKGYVIVSLFSAKPEQAAYFGAQGQLSFSSFFWFKAS